VTYSVEYDYYPVYEVREDLGYTGMLQRQAHGTDSGVQALDPDTHRV